MSGITIPPAALEAGRTAAEKVYGTQFFNVEIEAAFLAIVEAWPGMEFAEGVYCGQPYNDLILPLTEEASDGK